MKRGILVALVFVMACYTAFGQSCLPSGLWVTNQSQIDSFPINYPGCNEIEGNLILASGWIFNLDGLNQVTSIGGDFEISGITNLNNLSGLENLVSIGGHLSIRHTMGLQTLEGLNNLESVDGYVLIQPFSSMSDLSGLEHLTTIGGNLNINGSVNSLNGLENLSTVEGSIEMGYSDGGSDVTNLSGLSGLSYVGGSLNFYNNQHLMSLAGLGNVIVGENILIHENPLLNHCAVNTVCNLLANHPEQVYIADNAPGCDSPEEVEAECNGQTIIVTVLLDLDGDCQADVESIPAEGLQVRFNGMEQFVTRPTNSSGVCEFGNFENGAFYLTLPQFPTEVWGLCEDTIWVEPANLQDTIFATFLLQPLTACPYLSVELGLPPAFRNCLTVSDMQVEIKNIGAIGAENIQVAIVMPLSALDLLNSSLPVSAQNGDTLFFLIENLALFEAATIHLVVRTQCDTFLLGQTLCIEAFAQAENACPPETEGASEIRLYSQCLDDETVRFTLRNIGNAPTQSPHDFVIIEDEVILMSDDFTLNPNEERTVDIPANGATYRMEATRFDNGVLTAVALENCGGLTPGLITAYWLDEGLNNHDYACAEVIGSYDPNQKTAIPKGVGESHLLAANRPLQYTIEFQNTGTDTAFRVLLTDILSPNLDITTFRPGFSSHPYSWEIRGLDTLNVLFFPIALPDSNVNVAGSQGFFTFDIQQKRDLPNGTVIENTVSIVFDFNPPIVTNTTFHTIGELAVNIDEPAAGAKPKWKVFANPISATATFQALDLIPGEKRFELFDSAGRQIRNDQFDGQEFLFQRRELPGGLYFFRITDAKGKSASGKIVVAD